MSFPNLAGNVLVHHAANHFTGGDPSAAEICLIVGVVAVGAFLTGWAYQWLLENLSDDKGMAHGASR